MTELVHDAAMLGLSVDPLAMYRASPDELAFIAVAIDKVYETRDRIARGA